MTSPFGDTRWHPMHTRHYPFATRLSCRCWTCFKAQLKLLPLPPTPPPTPGPVHMRHRIHHGAIT